MFDKIEEREAEEERRSEDLMLGWKSEMMVDVLSRWSFRAMAWSLRLVLPEVRIEPKISMTMVNPVRMPMILMAGVFRKVPFDFLAGREFNEICLRYSLLSMI